MLYICNRKTIFKTAIILVAAFALVKAEFNFFKTL